MKKLLTRRWHGIPIGMIAVLALVGVVAAVGYTFLSHTIEITVDEPLTIEYNLQGQYGGDALWHELPDEDSLTIEGSAGDIFDIDLRINNRANSALTVTTTFAGDTEWFTLTGFPNGSIPASDGDDTDSPEWEGPTSIKIHGDTPMGTYSVTLNFNRS
jgi:hypothetical protein